MSLFNNLYVILKHGVLSDSILVVPKCMIKPHFDVADEIDTLVYPSMPISLITQLPYNCMHTIAQSANMKSRY